MAIQQDLILLVNQAKTTRDLQLVANRLKQPIRILWEHQYADKFKPHKANILYDFQETHQDLLFTRVNPNVFGVQKQ